MKVVNTVDLFCGGGGLSFGFENFRGDLTFKTVLAVDNDPAAVRCFNNNRGNPPEPKIPCGRICDITWFQQVNEIRLFYLIHLALSSPDNREILAMHSAGLDVQSFLRGIAEVDRTFERRLTELSKSAAQRDKDAVDPSVFSLAITRSFFSGLGLRPGIPFALHAAKLPWSEEATHAAAFPDRDGLAEIVTDPELDRNASEIWVKAVEKLTTASVKTGRGVNAKNGIRLQKLLSLFAGALGAGLRAAWCEWRGRRDSVRADFCLRNGTIIKELYKQDPVRLVLGGPPCKGFSRIGRPVIESLRDQGVHAWSDVQFGDERNALMCEYVLFLRAFAPDFFLFENVSNFQSVLRTPNGTLNAPEMLGSLIGELSNDSLHYDITSAELNAKNFAVPQDRRRFILAGVRAETASSKIFADFFDFAKASALPISTALLGLSKPIEFDFGADTRPTLSEIRSAQKRAPTADDDGSERIYLDWIQPVGRSVGENYPVDSHLYRSGREDDKKFLRYVAPGIRWMDLKLTGSPTWTEIRSLLRDCQKEFKRSGLDDTLRKRIAKLMERTDSSLLLRLLLEEVVVRHKLPGHHLLEEGYLAKGTAKHGDWFERLDFNRPCKTIVAHIGKDTYGFHHPFDRRPISVREAARIQSFPDCFSFAGLGVVDAYSIIGNAVPPLMSLRLAERIAALDSKLDFFGKEKIERARARSVSRQAA